LRFKTHANFTCAGFGTRVICAPLCFAALSARQNNTGGNKRRAKQAQIICFDAKNRAAKIAHALRAWGRGHIFILKNSKRFEQTKPDGFV